jgi:hypothetical protein
MDAPRLGWDSQMTLSSEKLHTLVSHLTAVVANDWMSMPYRHATESITAATDSSDELWGALVWSPERCLLPEMNVFARPWPRKMRRAHIFVKELTAAVIIVEQICQRYTNVEIVLIIDNTAAAAVLRRMASSTSVGMELACRADAALAQANNTLKVVEITSKANPSDEPSRGTPLDVSKFATMWRLIESSRRGIRINLPAKKFKRRSEEDATGTQIRHKDMEFHIDEYPSSSDEDDSSSNSSSDGEEWDVEATFDTLNVEHED